MVRFEPALDCLDGIVHGGLDHRAVEQTGRTWMGRNAGYDYLYCDYIPIGYGIGARKSCPTHTHPNDRACKSQ